MNPAEAPVDPVVHKKKKQVRKKPESRIDKIKREKAKAKKKRRST